LETGFQYCPASQLRGRTGVWHVLDPGSQNCPAGQLSGCAEPIAELMTDRAAIGPQAAATIALRRMILCMCFTFPERESLKLRP
jgi:hypothetical protein